MSSSDERQVVDLQLDALLAAGVDERHLHQNKQSGGRDDRVGLKTCLAGLRAGDVLVVWKLDRLGRSLSHLVRILDDLKGKGVVFRFLRKASTPDLAWRVPHNLFGTPPPGVAWGPPFLPSALLLAGTLQLVGPTSKTGWGSARLLILAGRRGRISQAPSASTAFNGRDPPRSDRARARPQRRSAV